MLIGIPKGFFYYDYHGFIKRLFDIGNVDDNKIKITMGEENDDTILELGNGAVTDETCLPIKLTAGQVEKLSVVCDKVLIPRIMKDMKGRWLCPKLLGLPELVSGISNKDKLLITDPIYFDNKAQTRKAFWKVCKTMGMNKKVFARNFAAAYEHQKRIAEGIYSMDVETAWEFTPEPSEGEIILPNTGSILLIGHCYNVYDKYANSKIADKLDMLGFDVITEKAVRQNDKELAVNQLGLIKTPFWESFVRVLGTVLMMKDKVDGIVYLSSFSCGPDSFIVEMIKTYIEDVPFIVLKLDEHKGTAGVETRLEAFADLLERRKNRESDFSAFGASSHRFEADVYIS